MEFYINNKAVEVFENQDINIQTQSSLRTFQLQGEKAYAFSFPNTAKLRGIIGNHHQSVDITKTIKASIKSSGVSLISGTGKIKSSNSKATSIEITVPPADIPVEVWNAKLTDIDIATHQLPTEIVLENIWTMGDKLKGISTYGNTVSFWQSYLKHGWVIRVKFLNSVILQHSFVLSNQAYSTDEARSIILSDFQATIDDYNDNPVILGSEFVLGKASLNFISPSTSGQLKVEISNEILAGGGRNPDPAETHIFDNIANLSYESAKTFLVNTNTRNLAGNITEHLRFHPIHATKFYGEQSQNYNGTLNYQFNGALATNNIDNRMAYPLVPSFSYKYIIETIFAKYGYSLEGPEWANIANYCFCAFVDFARQHPDTDMPYNIYPTEMVVGKYMPDITLKEFIDEFALSIGHVIEFEKITKKITLKSFKKIKSTKPIDLIESKIKVLENLTEDSTVYKIGYSTINTSELLNDSIKAFFGSETKYDGITKIPQKFLPMAALPDNFGLSKEFATNQITTRRVNTDTKSSTYPKLFALQSGRTLWYSLQDATPTPRSFFVVKNIPVTADLYSLSRTAENSFTKQFINELLNTRTGRTIKIQEFLNIYQYNQRSQSATYAYKGRLYISISTSISIKPNRRDFIVESELELI